MSTPTARRFLSRYWARELSWLYQTHGSFTAPLNADRSGHFVISNVFAGGIHISAQSPQFQEQRGEFEGSIAGEANNLSAVRRRRRRHDYGDRLRRRNACDECRSDAE